MTPTDDDKALLAWRNLVVHWHLEREVPLDCGCDDDTPDDGLCAPSVAYAERMYARRPDPALDGGTDPWDLESWTAAWGRNAPLIASPAEFRVPLPPAGLAWSVERVLVAGRGMVELALLGAPDSTIARGRSLPDPVEVARLAEEILRGEPPPIETP